MYIPNHYKNEDHEAITRFLQNNSFGILVNQADGKLWATHIPLELVTNACGKEVLQGHLSKENPQWKSFENDNKILAIFSGPHAYISSSWYEKEEVPTWNYVAVHIYGTVKILEESGALQSLKILVDKYEATSEKPIRIEELSQKTMMQVRGIVAFEIEIDEIQAVEKMSQTRSSNDHANIISELEKTGKPAEAEVAKIMRCPLGY
jgi:transcriptional regulator